MPRVLQIADLRTATARLLDAAEDKFGSELDLDAAPVPLDLYWQVSARSAYQMAEDPEHLAGSLTDDLEEVQDLIQRPLDETYLWHDLEHLCGLLRMLAFLDLPGVAD